MPHMAIIAAATNKIFFTFPSPLEFRCRRHQSCSVSPDCLGRADCLRFPRRQEGGSTASRPRGQCEPIAPLAVGAATRICYDPPPMRLSLLVLTALLAGIFTGCDHQPALVKARGRVTV